MVSQVELEVLDLAAILVFGLGLVVDFVVVVGAISMETPVGL